MPIGPIKRGALHRQLGYPQSEHIPIVVLRRIAAMPKGGKIQGKTVTELMKKRARFALNSRSWRK